jgi:hypothetical protein
MTDNMLTELGLLVAPTQKVGGHLKGHFQVENEN